LDNLVQKAFYHSRKSIKDITEGAGLCKPTVIKALVYGHIGRFTTMSRLAEYFGIEFKVFLDWWEKQ